MALTATRRDADGMLVAESRHASQSTLPACSRSAELSGDANAARRYARFLLGSRHRLAAFGLSVLVCVTFIGAFSRVLPASARRGVSGGFWQGGAATLIGHAQSSLLHLPLGEIESQSPQIWLMSRHLLAVSLALTILLSYAQAARARPKITSRHGEGGHRRASRTRSS